MRWHVVVLAAYLAGCSLIANPLDRFTFEPTDAGSPMDGGRDAGADAGSELDAASLDADFADAGPVPAAPVLRYPWNGYRTGSALTGELEPSRNALRPLLMWDPVSAAAYYEVALSSACAASTRAACDFSGALVASSDTTSWRPESSLPVSMSPPVGTTYAWRVRACNASCGEWSEVRYLHVGRVPGDFNGDGYADVVVGAQDVDDTEMNEGAAYLYAGNGAGVGSVPTTFSNPDPVLMARFGNAVGSGGDLNGDGFEDLVVGAYLQGVVHIYFGSPTGPATTPDLTLTDPLEPIASAYGWSIASGGDLNGDGYADLVVGAQSHDSPINAEGAVFVYLGVEGGVGRTPIVIDSPSGQELGQFGFSLATGDVDGDGLTDVVVGAVSYDGAVMDEGIAYVFRGRPSGIETSPHWALSNPAPTADAELGRSLACGDVDGDGFADIAVGAPFADDGASATGAAWLFRGGRGVAPSAVPVTRPTTEAMGWFGSSVAFLSDVNGDGLGDMAIGAPGIDSPASNEGLVLLLLGNASLSEVAASPRLVLPPDSRSGAWFGGDLAGGDVDADGLSDLVAGAPFFSGHGAVYVLGGDSGGIGPPLGPRLDHPGTQAGATFGWAVGHNH